jgi:tripartite-type tricarboxylate transporter receptor subunit TctC
MRESRTYGSGRGACHEMHVPTATWDGRRVAMKFPHRRQFLHLAASAAAAPAFSRIAMAQAYPSRPVRIIVGFPPGGPSDILARLMGQWLSERLGQPFVVENRPGAASNIATEAVVRAPADGYTLLLVADSAAINATLYDKLNFNFIRDIVPIAGIVRRPLVMLVNPSVPAKTVPEFIAYTAALADPKIKAQLADLAVTALPGSPADFGKLIADETEKWGKVIRTANIKPE